MKIALHGACVLLLAVFLDKTTPALAAVPPALPAEAPGMPPGSAPLPESAVPRGWCVIVEEQPLMAFPLAAEHASRLRAAGYPAGVYDTRSFANLAWGELVVIAQGFAGPDARAQATQLAATLAKLRRAARFGEPYAKPCEPLAPPARPIQSASELPPLPSLPTTPIPAVLQQMEGCVAWSPRDRAALCVVGASGDLGNEREVQFLRIGTDSPSDLDLRETQVDSALQSLTREVRQRGYVAVSGLARKLAPGATFHSAAPRFSFRWERICTSRGGDNAATRYRDRLFLRCGGPSAQELTLVEEQGAHESPSATLAAIPDGASGGPAVVLTTFFRAAAEGFYGSRVSGQVIDLKNCTRVPP